MCYNEIIALHKYALNGSERWRNKRMICKDCKTKMRHIKGQQAGTNIFQCDKCKRIDGESALKAIFG